MGQPFALVISGAVSARPFPGGAAGGQTLQEFVNLGYETSPTARQAGVSSVISVTDEPLDMGSVTKCRYLNINILSGALVVKVSNPTDADQIIRVGKRIEIIAPNPGEEIIGVTLTGTADFEYIAAGT